MINTACCELMEIFEQTITKTKKVISSMDTLSGIEQFSPTLKESCKTLWEQGALYFSYLMVDKLYKEDRLCENNCLRVYNEMTRNFDKIYNITNQIKLQ